MLCAYKHCHWAIVSRCVHMVTWFDLIWFDLWPTWQCWLFNKRKLARKRAVAPSCTAFQWTQHTDIHTETSSGYLIGYTWYHMTCYIYETALHDCSMGSFLPANKLSYRFTALWEHSFDMVTTSALTGIYLKKFCITLAFVSFNSLINILCDSSVTKQLWFCYAFNKELQFSCCCGHL